MEEGSSNTRVSLGDQLFCPMIRMSSTGGIEVIGILAEQDTGESFRAEVDKIAGVSLPTSFVVGRDTPPQDIEILRSLGIKGITEVKSRTTEV